MSKEIVYSRKCKELEEKLEKGSQSLMGWWYIVP
jgi:hypothetical protein